MKCKTVLLSGLLLLVASIGALAAEPASPPPAVPEAEEGLEEPITLTGKVTAVDAEKNTLAIETSEGQAKEFVVDPENTTIWLGYEEASLQDIKQGSEITVEYVTSAEGKNEATWIDILIGEAESIGGVMEEGKQE